MAQPDVEDGDCCCCRERYNNISMKYCKHSKLHDLYIQYQRFAVDEHPLPVNNGWNHRSKSYFPPPHNSRLMYETVRELGRLTVMVDCVSFTSTATMGSGRIWKVEKDQTVYVLTAMHVIGSMEHKQVDFYVDYDEETKPQALLHGKRLAWLDSANDICVVECETVDAVLAADLRRRLMCYEALAKKLYDRMKRKKRPTRRWMTSQWTLSTLVIIISHPHGGPKMISIGERVRRGGRTEGVVEEVSYSYTACSCNGSSGAPVYIQGTPSSDLHLVHIGKKEGTNYSSPALKEVTDARGNSLFCVFDKKLFKSGRLS